MTNLFGTGVFFHGPVFCELAQDWFVPADPPQDAIDAKCAGFHHASCGTSPVEPF